MKHLKCICLFFTAMICARLCAQNTFDQIDSLAGNLVKTLRAQNTERIFLQTDRKVFAVGEKIWFKALLVKSLNNRLDTSSKNLFVDLVNSKDQIVKQLVVNIVTQHTGGAISLNDSLTAGYYWLRGYTQKMIDNDIGSIFIQPVYVINTKKPVTDSITLDNKELTGSLYINFFPEGGALITGMNSTGALQVKDAAGNPVITSGYIASSKDSVVDNFATNRFGLARVTFYPKWFEKYQAVMHINGRDVKFPINAWDPFVAQISVIKQDRESLQTYISLEDSIYARKYTTYILGLSRDSVCFAGIGRGMCEIDIPVKNFPGGVATLLLFNEDKQLVSERKVFIDKDNYSLDIKTDKANYAARDKAKVDIEVKDAEGRPLVAALNIAVEDYRVMQMSDMLESDTLQPAGLSLDDWLKRDKSKLTREEIDLLMLAQPQGYKSPSSENTNTARLNPDNTELLSHLDGKIADRKDKPLPGRVVTGIVKDDKDAFLDVDTTGVGGGFRLNLPGNKENMLMMLQVADKRGNPEPEDKIDIDTFSFPRFATPVALKNKFTLASITPEVQVKKYHVDSVFIGVGKEWLAPVTVKAKVKKPDTYNTSKRINPFSHIISSDMISQGGYGNVTNVLLNIPGVSLKGRYIVFLGGSGFGADATQEPIVVMDGVQIPVMQMYPPVESPTPSPVMQFLNSLNPGDIDFIEVLTGADAGTFGANGGHGAIVINTKTHAENFTNGSSAFRIVSPKTYHTAPLFVMPDYSNKEIKEARGTDPRNTIYWNSNVITDASGKVSVNFYTADAATTYSLVITGITANGEYVYKRISINRK